MLLILNFLLIINNSIIIVFVITAQNYKKKLESFYLQWKFIGKFYSSYYRYELFSNIK